MQQNQNQKEKDSRNKQRQYFSTTRVKYVDYKDVDVLDKFVDTHARILPKHRTKISARNQRLLSQAVKRARFMALMPFVAK